MEAYKLDLNADFGSGEGSIYHMSLDDWSTLDKPSLAKKLAIFALDDEKPIEDIIRPPNADDRNPISIIQSANQGLGYAKSVRSVPWGWLVSVGEIMILKDNGQVRVVGPGRWSIKWYRRFFTAWGKRESITNNHISDDAFTLVRVQRGQLGLATQDGKAVLLQEGLHVYNDPLFKFVSFKNVDEEHINHMSYHVVRVPKGSFGMIMEQARAKLLPEGTHTVDNAVYKYCGLVPTIQQYINHGSIHIIQVPTGMLGLVFESNHPKLLHEGLHIYDSATLQFVGIKNKMDPRVVHGTITRFRVQNGEVALAWLDNEPVLIEAPGTYQVESPNFKLDSLRPATEKMLVLGSKKIITVYAGEVGVSFKGGALSVLPPGRHYIETADHIFEDFMSTKQLSIRLKSEAAEGRRMSNSDLLTCETKDLVRIGIRADVFYRISEPEKAIMQVGREFIPQLVHDTSVATLNNIVRSTALGEIAQSSQTSAQSLSAQQEQVKSAQAVGAPSAPLFFDKAHDQFLAKLHDDFKARYGLEITNIRIEQFKIMDDSLASSIAGQAVKTAETQSELANLEGQTKIATQQQERDARMRQIKAEADAKTLQVKADSEKAQAEAVASAQKVRSDMEANTLRTKVEAEGDAIRTKAQAEADAAKIQAEAIISKAKAEAEAIRLKAEAESKRAELLAKNPLGEKLSLLEIYGDMVKTSNQGVSKVVYVDPTTTQAGNPLSLLTLQSLQADLKELNGQ